MITELKGDLLTAGLDVICHQVNCQGKMGSGIAKSIRERFPQVYHEYSMFCAITESAKLLSEIQPVIIDEYMGKRLIVVNMFSQYDFGYDGRRYTSYDAFWTCLNRIKKNIPIGSTIGFPKYIGCCRGGANWEVIRKMIEEVFDDREVYIYELEV